MKRKVLCVSSLAVWFLIFRKSPDLDLLKAYFLRTMKFLAFWKRKKVE